jgi:hypothetical protein
VADDDDDFTAGQLANIDPKLGPVFVTPENLDRALARVARLEAALEAAAQALACVSCAEDVPPCPDHGDPIEAIQIALLPDAPSPSPSDDG